MAPDALEVHYEEPVERAFGDVHEKCTRNHQRKRLWTLVRDVGQHLAVNGPWQYALSEIYYTPEVTAAYKRWRKRPPHRKNAHNLPLECTNVLWSDLKFLGARFSCQTKTPLQHHVRHLMRVAIADAREPPSPK